MGVPRDAADSKQLHTAKASADGLLAAYLAKDGFTGATRILEGAQGMAAGMSSDADPAKLTDRLGERWALVETSFKYHASCRHTHPAADALLAVVEEHELAADDIATVTAHVHQAAIDVLGPVVSPSTGHQAKFSMGTVLGLIATYRKAGLAEFQQHFADAAINDFRRKVTMVLDAESIGRTRAAGSEGDRAHRRRPSVLARVDEPRATPATLCRAQRSWTRRCALRSSPARRLRTKRVQWRARFTRCRRRPA